MRRRTGTYGCGMKCAGSSLPTSASPMIASRGEQLTTPALTQRDPIALSFVVGVRGWF